MRDFLVAGGAISFLFVAQWLTGAVMRWQQRRFERQELADRSAVFLELDERLGKEEARAAASRALLSELEEATNALTLLQKEMPELMVRSRVDSSSRRLEADVTMPNFREHLPVALRLLSQWGFRQLADPSFNKEYGWKTYNLGKILLRCSSDSCQRVKVGEQSVPVYETRCE